MVAQKGKEAHGEEILKDCRLQVMLTGGVGNFAIVIKEEEAAFYILLHRPSLAADQQLSAL